MTCLAPRSVATWGQPLPGRGQGAIGIEKMPPPVGAANVFGGRGGSSIAVIGRPGPQSSGSVRDPVGAGPKQAAVLNIIGGGKNRTLRDAFVNRPEGLRTPVARSATPEVRAARVAAAASTSGTADAAGVASIGSPLDAAIQLVIAAEGALPEDTPEGVYREITADGQRLKILKAASASRGLTGEELAFVDGVSAKYGQMVQALAAEGVEGARAIAVEEARVPLQERQKQKRVDAATRDYQNAFARVRELADEVNREELLTGARARRRDLLERNMNILRRDWGAAFVEGDREAVADLNQLWAMTRNGLETLDRQDREGVVKLASLGRQADNAIGRTEDLENKLQEAVEAPIGASRAAAMKEEQTARFARHDRDKAKLLEEIRALTDTTRVEARALAQTVMDEAEQGRRRQRREGDLLRNALFQEADLTRQQMSQESFEASEQATLTRDAMVEEAQRIQDELAAARRDFAEGVNAIKRSTRASKRAIQDSIGGIATALEERGVAMDEAINMASRTLLEDAQARSLQTSREIENMGLEIEGRIMNEGVNVSGALKDVSRDVAQALAPGLQSAQAETAATKAAVGALASGLTGTNIQVRRPAGAPGAGTFLGRAEGQQAMSVHLVNSGAFESDLVADRSGLSP